MAFYMSQYTSIHRPHIDISDTGYGIMPDPSGITKNEMLVAEKLFYRNMV